jgi:hypothetical protein
MTATLGKSGVRRATASQAAKPENAVPTLTMAMLTP